MWKRVASTNCGRVSPRNEELGVSLGVAQGYTTDERTTHMNRKSYTENNRQASQDGAESQAIPQMEAKSPPGVGRASVLAPFAYLFGGFQLRLFKVGIELSTGCASYECEIHAKQRFASVTFHHPQSRFNRAVNGE